MSTREPLRIGVDACCWANGRGYGRFTRELVRHMVALAPEDRFVCFLDDAAVARFDLDGPNVEPVLVALSESPTRAAAANGNRAALDLLRLTRATWHAGLDVFFSPSIYTYYPLPPRLPAVVTIHDAIAERFPELTLPTKRARLFWRAKVSLAVWQARYVLTVSDFAARDLAEVIGIAPSRIRVAGEAPAPAYRPSQAQQIAEAAAALGLPADAQWFLYVGGFNPHKHVDAIVRAHAQVVASRRRPPYLVLVGATDDVFHDSLDVIRQTIGQAGTQSLVRWPGYLPDEQLAHLHSGARGLVLPSASEGFGLPAVEAAACGSPVIATTASPLPDLLEGGGMFVEPGDERALAEAMGRLLDDPCLRDTLGAHARERASRLTWDAGARAALDVIHEAAR